MSYLQTYQIFPHIPENLAFLENLSRNLWWSWRLDAIELFRRINPRLWELSGRNPIIFSTMIPQKRFEEISKNEGFLSHMERVKESFNNEVLSPAPAAYPGMDENGKICYFSMEFGIHESLPLFAGGLGVLAGDHLKASSDICLPLVGVGLMYRRGYFHQYLDHNGWQQEEYPETNLYHLPVERARDPLGNEVRIKITGPDCDINAVVWLIKVGRISLFLLDTNIMENPPEIRELTARLYAADSGIRLAQESLIGIGGMRALKAMNIFPVVCHMNEGHSAFSGLERLADIIESNDMDIKGAWQIAARTTVFTTHTPVAAGHDEFQVDMVKPYLAHLEKRLSSSINEIISWGQHNPGAPFSMFVLGLRISQYCNGVSMLHGKTARHMWSNVWPEKPEDEIPITHVTNGVHIPSWISIENSLLFDRYLGPEWYMKGGDEATVNRIDEIYDEELWRAHEMSRSRLVRTCRSQMIRQNKRRNAPKAIMSDAESVLDQDVLTIAFARRFATYKRANLLLHDPERLMAILSNKEYPVQFIFAGKAHPKDNEGKALIQNIIRFAHDSGVSHKMIFLEDYDINIARHLVQGADVWLNTPRRPYEACGTSGIKAAANGVLNLSILDGWWCEGYSEKSGWRIGSGEVYEDYAYQDAVEAQALYNVLEDDVIPCFYHRRDSDIPDKWLDKMKESMKMAMSGFCAHKMVSKYDQLFYRKASERLNELLADEAKEARALEQLHQSLINGWGAVRVDSPSRASEGPFRVGDSIIVTTKVELGGLKPENVEVELYYGKIQSLETVEKSNTIAMEMTDDLGNDRFLYSCSIPCKRSGRYGFTARVIPRGDDLIKHTPGLITWA